jgi:hypothetical protein
MLSRGGICCDWIETFTMVPEGAHVGERMVLLPFQRDFVYAIYNGNDGCTPGKEEEALQMQLLRRDIPALKLAIQVAVEQEGRALQFEKISKQGRSGWRLGVLAACICQYASLELEPHQHVPAHIALEDRPQPQAEMEDAAALVRKLVAADVSRLHPDPAAEFKKVTGKSLV